MLYNVAFFKDIFAHTSCCPNLKILISSQIDRAIHTVSRSSRQTMPQACLWQLVELQRSADVCMFYDLKLVAELRKISSFATMWHLLVSANQTVAWNLTGKTWWLRPRTHWWLTWCTWHLRKGCQWESTWIHNFKQNVISKTKADLCTEHHWDQPTATWDTTSDR